MPLSLTLSCHAALAPGMMPRGFLAWLSQSALRNKR